MMVMAGMAKGGAHGATVLSGKAAAIADMLAILPALDSHEWNLGSADVET